MKSLRLAMRVYYYSHFASPLRRLLDAALAALVTETDPEDEVAMVALPSASATTTAATVVGAEEVTAILIAAAQGTSTTTVRTTIFLFREILKISRCNYH
mgnify:CR=1 FL=1